MRLDIGLEDKEFHKSCGRSNFWLSPRLVVKKFQRLPFGVGNCQTIERWVEIVQHPPKVSDCEIPRLHTVRLSRLAFAKHNRLLVSWLLVWITPFGSVDRLVAPVPEHSEEFLKPAGSLVFPWCPRGTEQRPASHRWCERCRTCQPRESVGCS